MQNAIIAYFAILVLMVIATLFLTGVIGGKHTSTTTTVIATTSLPSGQTTTNVTTQSTSSIPFVTCLSHNSTSPIFNGYFATGNWLGWNTTGSGFGKAPFNITAANRNTNPNYTGYYGAPWRGYNGTYMATTFQTGVALSAGNLTSNQFLVNQLYLNFKIISQHNDQLYVEILKGGKPAIIDHYNTYVSPPNVQNAQSTFENASIPMGTLLCQNVSIRVVAAVVGQSFRGTNYIAVTGFYQSSTPAANPTQPTNQSFMT